jgi:hypothetical protein
MSEPPNEPESNDSTPSPTYTQRAFRVASSGWTAAIWLLGSVLVLVWGLRTNTHKPEQQFPLPVEPVQQGPGRVSVKVTEGVPCDTDAGVCSHEHGSESSHTSTSVGKTLAGMLVSVWSEREPGRFFLSARGTTDAAGEVQFPGLPSGPVWILTRGSGFARASVSMVVRAAHDLSVQLLPARTFVVRVDDEQGAPIVKGTVLVNGRDVLPFGRLTDEHGVARFEDVSEGPYEVAAFAKGYSSVKREKVERDLRLVLAQLGSIQVGVVNNNGEPVPHAEVHVVGTRLWPARKANTDDQGRVVLGGLPEGLYDLRATKGMWVSSILPNLNLERGERRQVELRVAPGKMLTVDVQTADDEASPIAHARLVLAEHGLSAFPVMAVTNSEGRAHIGPLSPDPAFVSARAEGFIARGAVPVPEGSQLNIRLYRGGTVRGDVEDVDGRPIRDARVEIVGLDLDGLPIAESPLSAAYREAHFDFSARPLTLVPAGELGVTHGPIPFVNMVLDGPETPTDLTQLPPDYSPWTSDDEGHFRAGPVPPGKIRVIVRHNAFAEGQSRVFTMGPGGNVHVKVVLDVGHVLRGRVLDDGDRPVAKARVLVNGVHNGFERAIVSERDGTFQMRGVPSEVNVSLARPDEPTRFIKRQKLSLTRGDASEVEFVLPEEREPVQVVVYDDVGAPIELAQVSVQSVDPDVPLRMTQFTDANGVASFRDASGLALRVQAEAPGFIPGTQQFKVTADHQFTLQRGVLVSGRITAVRGRAPVAGAQVILEAGSRRDVTTTSTLGEFEFGNIPPGRISLRIQHDDYATTKRSVTIEPTGHERRAFEIPDIDLADAVSVRGVVKDRDGRAVPAARVSTQPISEVRPKAAVDEEVVLSDEQGRFVLTGVTPGVVVVYAQSAIAGKGQARIEALEDRDLEGVVVTLTVPIGDEDSDYSSATGSVALSFRSKGGALLIVDVPAGGEAERAGLRGGDAVSEIDGQSPKDPSHARALMTGPIAGDVVIGVLRDGETHTFRVRREQVSK